MCIGSDLTCVAELVFAGAPADFLNESKEEILDNFLDIREDILFSSDPVRLKGKAGIQSGT